MTIFPTTNKNARGRWRRCGAALVAWFVVFHAFVVWGQNLIQNGNFTNNAAAFTNYPGYINGSNPAAISSWTSTLGANVGINGAGVGFAGSPFGPTNSGNFTYAFLQRVAAMTNGLTQNLSLTASTTYQLTFNASARSGNSPLFQVRVGNGSQFYFSSTNLAANSAAFASYFYTFTTPATITGTPAIGLYNITTNSSTDYTVDFANVTLAGVTTSTFTWTNISGGNASGSWSAQTSWSGGVLPTTIGSTALFNSLNITSDSTVTLDGNVAVNALVFSDATTATPANWIIDSGSPASSNLTLGGTSPQITVTNLASGEAAVINAVIAGTNGMTKTGTSFLQLNGANTYSGGTVLSGSDCRISVGNANAFGTGTVTVGATSGAGEAWLNASNGLVLTNAFDIQAIRWIIDNSTVAGVPAGSLTVNGNVLLATGSSGVRDIYCNENLTINGNVSVTPTSNPMNVNGDGVLTLNGTNTVGGASTVNGSTLVVNGVMSNAATFTVNSELSGTGSFSGNIAVASNGSLTVGSNGSGTFTCGGLTSVVGSGFNFALGATNNPSNGLIKVNGNLTLAGTVNIVDLGGFSTGIYTGINYTGMLVNNGLQIGAVPDGKSVAVYTNLTNYVLFYVLSGNLSPTAGESLPMDLTDPLVLSWVQVPNAVTYNIYFGASSNSVGTATANTGGIFLGTTNGLMLDVSSLQPDTTYYWRVDGVTSNGVVIPGQIISFTTGAPMVDLMEDTWVATDALGRSLPGLAECGSPRTNRPVGMFYFLWQESAPEYGSGTNWDVSAWIGAHPFTNAHNPWADNPVFQTAMTTYWWGHPALGYYSPRDPWALRRQIALLAHAGIDVLILDYSNGVTYDTQLYALLNMIRQMRFEGYEINLKIAFLTHANSGTTATYLYDTLYGAGQYSDLWFYWNGKPLILGDINGSGNGDTVPSSTVQNFFTWRTSWANDTELADDWQWIDSVTPQNWGYDTRPDLPEELSVSCGGWANSDLGRSYTNHTEPTYSNYDLPVTATQGQGLFFAEEMNYGLKYDPEFLYVTGWNEWMAGSFAAPTYCYTDLLSDCCPVGGYYFVDEYNEEYSRDIEPMQGGHTDNYYFQMVGQNRLRKGVRPVPAASAQQTINFANGFSQWTNVAPSYYDPVNDTIWRNFSSAVPQAGTYTNQSGRNDFTVMKVARDATNFYFLAQCNSNITSYTGLNWMVLFINSDTNYSTGWQGYDYAINLGARTASTTTLSQNTTTTNGWTWTTVRSDIAYTVSGNQLMIAVPRASVGLGADPVTFDFHWADNFQTNDIADFGVDGDSAPDRRFNYRYQVPSAFETILLQDGFENGEQSFWNWPAGGSWAISGTTPYSGEFSAESCVTNGAGSSTLSTSVNNTNCSSMRVSFYYKLQNVGPSDNVAVTYKGTNGSMTITNLGEDLYYPTNQAWGYNERTNVWLRYSDVRYNSGAGAQFFTTNFTMSIVAPLTLASKSVSIDNVEISGVTTNLNPPMLTVAQVLPNSVLLSWPTNYIGYTLQGQTNAANIGLTTSWYPVNGVVSNQITVPILSGPGCMFFRLVAPIQ